MRDKDIKVIRKEIEKMKKSLEEVEKRLDHPVSYTHLRAHETVLDLVCRLLLEKKKKKIKHELQQYELKINPR